jgi:putative ABC transport system permease protein
MHFAGTGMGIEPDKYPLAGSLTIGDPTSTGLPTLLQKAGDVVITRDLAERYNLKVGDRIVLSDLRVGAPLKGTLRGIAYDTPNHQGEKLYYSLATAQKLANGQPGIAPQTAVNTVIVNTAHPETLIAKLESSGWSVDWVAGRGQDRTANLWMLGLRGAGILGLLVGGIGIANTMQVLLRRRQREIAIWKTLGYRQGDLRLIFSLEAGLLGLAGSLLGAGLGVLISSGLLELFLRTSSMLYQWTFSPTPPLMGILVGTLATLIFAAWAIVVTGQARPMALLRNERLDVQDLPGCQSVVLGLILGALFTALTSLVMESLAAGIGVLVCIVIGIAMLGAFFKGVLWVASRAFPPYRFSPARLAFNSLHRGGLVLVFAMIALFVGVFSMSLGVAVLQFSDRRISSGQIEVQGYNLEILAPAGQESAIRQAIQDLNPEKVSVGYRTALEGLRVDGSGEPIRAMDAVLVGRSDPGEYLVRAADPVRGAAWGSRPDGVYAYTGANLEAGSQVQATFRDGTTKTFTVVGTYDINYGSMTLYPPTGLLMTAEGFTRVAQADSLTYFVQVAPDQVSRAAAGLGSALPDATVVDLVAYAGRFMRSYKNLYILAIAMAGLALLAGILLIANAVSLAMLERRYEIGILKTSGYSLRQILFIFAVEYGLAGLLATVAGVLVVQGLLAVMSIANHMAVSIFLMTLPSQVFLIIAGTGLTLIVVFGVIWDPARVPPAVVLNERNG